MIKLAYIINSVRNNGPTNVLLNMVKGLDKKKFKASVITLFDDNDINIVKELKSKNIEVLEINLKKSFFSLFNIRKIKSIINKQKYDIIHTHSHIPTFVAKNINAIRVTTVHCRLEEDFINTYGKIKGYIINKLYISALKRYDSVVCCSKSTLDIVSKYIKKAIYIRNGIDFKSKLSNEKLRKELKIPDNAIVYIFVGILSTRKNVINLVKKMSKIMNNNEYLLILGDGPLIKDVKQYEQDNIKVLGFKDNVSDYLNISDVYVSFSLSEGFPISVIEALSSNLLVLLSNIPSHEEFFNINKQYYIGESFSLKNIDSKIELIRKNVNKKCDSKKFQEKYLSATAMMKEYMIVYKDFCRKD